MPLSVAGRVELPKAEHKDVNYYQVEDVAAICEALESEPPKWKVLVYMLLITGARRGELLGLKWKYVELDNNRIYICNNVIYAPDRGIYEDTAKTKTAYRYITLPQETVELLRLYKSSQTEEHIRAGGVWYNRDFVFTQYNGNPLHPVSVKDFLKKFSKRRGLPHINAHAFRLTMASMLYFIGADSVSISKRLGHAQVFTTANIYAHVMEEANLNNAEILGDIFLK